MSHEAPWGHEEPGHLGASFWLPCSSNGQNASTHAAREPRLSTSSRSSSVNGRPSRRSARTTCIQLSSVVMSKSAIKRTVPRCSCGTSRRMLPGACHQRRRLGTPQAATRSCDADEAAATDPNSPDGPEHWIHILPDGPDVGARDGRAFSVPDLDAVIQASELPMLVDWEHGSGRDKRAPPDGSTSCASTRHGGRAGTWGRVTWTPAGRADVASRATATYRQWCSRRKRTPPAGRHVLQVQRIASVALTNRPALRMQGIQVLREQLSERIGPIDDDDDGGDMNNCSRSCARRAVFRSRRPRTTTSPRSPSAPAHGTDAVREALSTVTRERNDALARVAAVETELATHRAAAFRAEVGTLGVRAVAADGSKVCSGNRLSS